MLKDDHIMLVLHDEAETTMDFTMVGEKQSIEAPSIAGDRRRDRRYGIQLDLKWKLVRRRRLIDTGTGRTVDLSSGGLLFDAGRHLPEGLNVELSIAWPVLLHNVAPLQLAASGRILRCEGRMIAVQMIHHEFRTASVPAERRVSLGASGRAPSAAASSFGVINGAGKPQ
jgi:hypothetical protein